MERRIIYILLVLLLSSCKRSSSQYEVNTIEYDGVEYVVFESEFCDIAVIKK